MASAGRSRRDSIYFYCYMFIGFINEQLNTTEIQRTLIINIFHKRIYADRPDAIETRVRMSVNSRCRMNNISSASSHISLYRRRATKCIKTTLKFAALRRTEKYLFSSIICWIFKISPIFRADILFRHRNEWIPLHC